MKKTLIVLSAAGVLALAGVAFANGFGGYGNGTAPVVAAKGMAPGMSGGGMGSGMCGGMGSGMMCGGMSYGMIASMPQDIRDKLTAAAKLGIDIQAELFKTPIDRTRIMSLRAERRELMGAVSDWCFTQKLNAFEANATAAATVTPTAAVTSNDAGSQDGTAMAHGHGMMQQEPLAALKGKDFDVAFYSMMIPHHQAAVEMAQKVEGSADPQIAKWAGDIIKTQTAEIAMMRQAVEQLGGIDPAYYDAMEADMKPMVEDTKNDRDFVRLMIPHHQLAIDMAELAPGRTDDPALLQLCKAIVAAQTQEIAGFEAWLQK